MNRRAQFGVTTGEEKRVTVNTGAFGGAANELLAPQRLLLEIIETVRESILIVDDAYCVTHANRVFYRTFNAAAPTTIGKPLIEIGNGQWNIPRLQELLFNTLRMERQVSDFNIDHTFAGIGRKILHVNVRLVAQPAPLPQLIVLAIEDVTTRQLSEWLLAEQRVELQRSNAALEEFASVASHDLQEPLRKIISFGDLLQSAAGPVLAGPAADHLTRMRAAAARMRDLINDLLLYSQVSTRPQTFAETDLGVIARDVIGDLETTIADAGGQVEIGELPAIDADPLQIRRLLQNLIGNAIKYRRPNVPPVVRVASSGGSRGQCVITVSDNGIGFSQAHAEKIFGMFERLHNRAQYAGSGIGLAVSRKIVERHGGTIAATSSIGQGATFMVTLPLTHTLNGHTP
jgi:signal transduction histidine kinase